MKHKLNFAKECLSIGECVCCHKRNDHIVIGDGRCTDCIYAGCSNENQLTRDQRDYFIGSFGIFIGMIAVFIIQRALEFAMHPAVKHLIFGFAMVSIAISTIIYVYSLIKKS